MAMTELKELVSISKASYYENLGKKLYIQLIKLNPTGLFLKRFVVTINTIIWPLADVKTKANIFNKYFAKQCTPLKNDSFHNQDCTHMSSVLLKYKIAWRK